MITFLVNIGEQGEAINQVEQDWIHDLLDKLGADIEELSEYDQFELSEYFNQNNLNIIKNMTSGSLNVYYQDEHVGGMSSPTFEVNVEDGKSFYKITIDEWVSEELILDDNI